jgi:hypothetical protein
LGNTNMVISADAQITGTNTNGATLETGKSDAGT